jgi:DNA repair protein RecO (recombination protein O)
MTGNSESLRAWLLHSRPFRDTSLLLDFLTLENGRVSAIARGVRNSKSRGRSILQPFIPLQITVMGKHDLQTLRSFEPAASSIHLLAGERLFAGFYLNELLVKLLSAHDAEPDLFHMYEQTIQGLAQGLDLEPLLRCFELQLLETLGYGIPFDHDSESGAEIEPEYWYFLQAESGFVKQLQLPPNDGSRERAGLFAGKELQNINDRNFTAAATRRVAKRLLRDLLQRHLGGREISSRALFRQRSAEA